MDIQWKKITFITALILTLFSFPSWAVEGQYPKQCKPGTEMMKQHYESMLKELGVTADQKQKLDAIMQESRIQAEPVRKCMWEKKQALMQYIFSSQATKEQALCKAKEITDTKYQLEEIFINGMFKAKCILTPEQQQKFIELHQKKMMKFEKYKR
ncbi:MAG: periplasmic heavy metal sensor [Candidatus Gastranaerophilales bacterium]|nr:periplasmic heavy metal sensor [Candidatus Gastranaerophilales bacterium]